MDYDLICLSSIAFLGFLITGILSAILGFNDWKELIAVAVLVILCFFVGVVAGANSEEDQYQKQAIEKGFAEYDSVTGEWKWKEK